MLVSSYLLLKADFLAWTPLSFQPTICVWKHKNSHDYRSHKTRLNQLTDYSSMLLILTVAELRLKLSPTTPSPGDLSPHLELQCSMMIFILSAKRKVGLDEDSDLITLQWW